MEDIITFSPNYTGKLLFRYYALHHEGLMFIDVSELEESIKIMSDLYIVGTGHIHRLRSIESYLDDGTPSFIFSPELKIDAISTNPLFIESLNEGSQYWHVETFDRNKIFKTPCLPTEMLYMNVDSKNICFTGVPYENEILNYRFFSALIELDSLKIT
ncbi:MAG TPA: hypothetical protein VF411_11295 [Bacteroidia bacterium]